jgi:hypothetical protein
LPKLPFSETEKKARMNISGGVYFHPWAEGEKGERKTTHCRRKRRVKAELDAVELIFYSSLISTQP